MRGTLIALTAVTALVAGSAATAHAEEPSGPRTTLDAPDFKAPFECGTTWRYFSYDGHDNDRDLPLDFNTGNGPDDDRGLPALASAAGTARVAFDNEGGGKYVEIDHGGGWVSGVFHLDEQTVKTGDKVKQGQEVGKVGDTHGDGPIVKPHLHYQVKLNGELQEIELGGKNLYPYPIDPDTKDLTSTNCDGDDPGEPEEPKKTELAYTGAKSASNGSPVKLAAKLTDEDDEAVAKRKVAFALGTGDSAQKCTGKTNADGKASCEIDSVKQKLTMDGTVPVTAKFAGDDEYEPSKKSAELKLEYVSGRAFGLSADAPLGLPVSVEPTPDTGEVRTAGEETEAPPCAQNLNALLISADALCAEVKTETGPSKVTATATLAKASVELPGLPVVGLSGVRSTSTSTCSATSGSVDLKLTVLGETVETGDTPDLEVDLGVAGVKLVVNEQIETDDGGLTVNAAHLTGPGGLDVVIGSSTSTAHNCT